MVVVRDKKRAERHSTAIQYALDDKLACVTALVAFGGLTYKGIDEAHKILPDVHQSTLARWLNAYGDQVQAAQSSLSITRPDVPAIVRDTRHELLENLQTGVLEASRKLSAKATIDAMSARDAAVFLGIGIEKILLITKHRPDLDSVIDAIADECRRLHYEVKDYLEDILMKTRALPTPRDDSDGMIIE